MPGRVITNLDREHLDSYGTFEALQSAFVDFANKVPFYGAVVACADDPVLASLLTRLTRRVITYGFDDGADVQGIEPRFQGFGARCGVRFRGAGATRESGELRLRVPGRHSVLNALASVAVSLEVGMAFEDVAAALAGFVGVSLRNDRSLSSASATCTRPVRDGHVLRRR